MQASWKIKKKKFACNELTNNSNFSKKKSKLSAISFTARVTTYRIAVRAEVGNTRIKEIIAYSSKYAYTEVGYPLSAMQA